MHQYEVIRGPITLPIGVIVRLSDLQAGLRAHALKKQRNGAYEIVQPVQFKNGETLGFENVPDKALLAAFFSPEKIKEIQVEQSSTPKTEKQLKKPTADMTFKEK